MTYGLRRNSAAAWFGAIAGSIPAEDKGTRLLCLA